MDRRHLVRLAMLTTAGLALAPSLVGVPATAASATTARRLVAMLRHPESAAAIGRVYLGRFPAAGVVDQLVAGLSDVWQAGGQAGDLRARLRTRIRDDFVHDRTVAVDGWILAESEVRLYALAALLET